MPLFSLFVTGSEESGWYHMAVELTSHTLCLLCMSLSAHSSCVLHEVRLLVFMLHNPDVQVLFCIIVLHTLFMRLVGGADKSVARPRRKQATGTKLGIYSTYSPRSSIHFLARCSNFCKPLKKKSEGCPSNQVSTAAMTSVSDEKWLPFSCFFSPGNRW